jgi:2-amino-4-hydroxy-6-hydroxymethyldihydropteridine diphosphokinase
MSRPVRAFLGLGSNLGDRARNLRRAVELLDGRAGVRVVRTSSLFETEPVGPPQPNFVNAAVEIETALSARELLRACMEVEAELGRTRDERWGPRTIDVDVLLYDDELIDEPGLRVPHPRMHERAFVLVPLAELAPDVPLADGRTVAEAAREREGVRPFQGAPDPAGWTTVGIVGAGRVGTALGVLLRRAGYRVVAASGRDATRERVARFLPGTRFVGGPDAVRDAAVAIVAVPDDLIASTVSSLAEVGAIRRGQTVVHVSGSTSLAALDAARDAGARVLSLHPLQSFPDVETGIGRLPGSGIAVTATNDADAALGERIARDVGGSPFLLDDEVKPLYHAGAVFAANYLVTVEALAERMMLAAGLSDPSPYLRELARTSFDRTFDIGPGAALTGPAVRGDVGTIERNLAALAERVPEALEAYVALGRAAARLAADEGRLRPDDRRHVEDTLERWR